MKSRFRKETIVLFLLFLAISGIGSYVIIRFWIEKNSISSPTLGNSLALTLGPFLLGFFYMVINSKTIEFTYEEVIVKYLFRFRTDVFKYTDIRGYQWKYLGSSSLINFKTIHILTSHSKIKLPDFAYANFRELEKYITGKLELKITDEWRNPSPEERKMLIQRSVGFDLKHAKDMRIYSFVWLLLFFFFILTISYNNLGKRTSTVDDIILIILSFIGLFFMIRKFTKSNRFVKEKKYNQPQGH